MQILAPTPSDLDAVGVAPSCVAEQVLQVAAAHQGARTPTSGGQLASATEPGTQKCFVLEQQTTSKLNKLQEW